MEIKYFLATGNPEIDRFMISRGFVKSDVLNKEVDFTVYDGGIDVFPMMYNQLPIDKEPRNYNISRDLAEQVIYRQTLELGIPSVGICRGGQLLHVLNGGTLWQDVDNHHCSHWARFIGPSGERELLATSSHHQMMRPDSNQEFTILGMTIGISTNKLAYDMKNDVTYAVQSDILDIEALYYPHTRSFCFQPHPEYGNAKEELQDFFVDTILEII